MENASKALIIAGAILISIILISIGIIVVTSSQSFVDKAGSSLDQAEVERFNNQFLGYEGVQKGSQIKNLMTKIGASNTNSDNADSGRVVKVMYEGSEKTTDEVRQAVRPTSSYTVAFTTDPQTSLVSTCTITSGTSGASGSSSTGGGH